MRFHNSSKVLANLRNHTFEEQVKKYAAIWGRPADGVAAVAGPPVALPNTSGPEVGQKYDLPSSGSIRPVGIIAPEGSPPREPPASESTDVTPPQPAPQASQPTSLPAGAEPPVQSAPAIPIPPHRPPQVRAAAPRAAAPPQLPPIELRGTPPPPPGLIR